MGPVVTTTHLEAERGVDGAEGGSDADAHGRRRRRGFRNFAFFRGLAIVHWGSLLVLVLLVRACVVANELPVSFSNNGCHTILPTGKYVSFPLSLSLSLSLSLLSFSSLRWDVPLSLWLVIGWLQKVHQHPLEAPIQKKDEDDDGDGSV